ncbi:hypothetical protein Golomagni_07467 [Golovinomyces magnicellulatus]|nr:hypothetical protein Golomagni_07467 [Golovinomyces magnicellulatus]
MKPVILYTAGTPNGQKVSNFTEELKRAYPSFEVEYQAISLGKNEQKEDWFLAINPNGRIPALKDPNRGDFCVFETAAIILYLEKHYDPDHIFSWSDDGDGVDRRSEVTQWLYFVHGGIGPMQGQANHFVRYAPEDIPYGKNRYVTETKRLYQVLDRSRLAGGRQVLDRRHQRVPVAAVLQVGWSEGRRRAAERARLHRPELGARGGARRHEGAQRQHGLGGTDAQPRLFRGARQGGRGEGRTGLQVDPGRNEEVPRIQGLVSP